MRVRRISPIFDPATILLRKAGSRTLLPQRQMPPSVLASRPLTLHVGVPFTVIMSKTKKNDAPELIESWTLPPTVTLGSSVREGNLLEMRAPLPLPLGNRWI